MAASPQRAEGPWFREGRLAVAVLGAGKIGTILAEAFVGRGWTVLATGRSEETLERARRAGAIPTRDNREACRRADAVVLAVKPRQLPELVEEIGSEVAGKTVVSVVAGVSTAALEGLLRGAGVVRAMPSISALARASLTALSAGRSACGRDREVAEELFRSVGEVVWVSEEHMDAITALLGSGPAFVAEVADALTLGAVAAGVPRDLAYRAVLKLLEGTAETLRRTGWHPAQLRDAVVTPAGTTAEGLRAMEGLGVRAAIIEAILRAAARSAELGREASSLLDARRRTATY